MTVTRQQDTPPFPQDTHTHTKEINYWVDLVFAVQPLYLMLTLLSHIT
jgi:hypothetical protein